MKKAWEKYTTSLKKISKQQFDLLNAGATKEEIALLKSSFDFELPQSLIDLYEMNNGQIQYPYQGSTFISLSFMDITDLLVNYKVWKDLFFEPMGMNETFGDYFDYEKEGGKSFPEKAIKVKYINLKWIPIFHDGGGNHIGIDLDPGVKGTLGQIINFGRDQNEKYVLAKDLEHFFLHINAHIDAGELKCEKAVGFDALDFQKMSFGNPLENNLIGDLINMIKEKRWN
jgi:cell wall assembly regulator SMI1